MKTNGEFPSDKSIAKKLKMMQTLLVDLSEHVLFIECAVTILFGVVVGISDKAEKQKALSKILRDVNRQHKKAWRRKHKLLSQHL